MFKFTKKDPEHLNYIVHELETISNKIEATKKSYENDLDEYCRSIRNKILITTEENISLLIDFIKTKTKIIRRIKINIH